jgi:hypothetical protein
MSLLSGTVVWLLMLTVICVVVGLWIIRLFGASGGSCGCCSVHSVQLTELLRCGTALLCGLYLIFQSKKEDLMCVVDKVKLKNQLDVTKYAVLLPQHVSGTNMSRYGHLKAEVIYQLYS